MSGIVLDWLKRWMWENTVMKPSRPEDEYSSIYRLPPSDSETPDPIPEGDSYHAIIDEIAHMTKLPYETLSLKEVIRIHQKYRLFETEHDGNLSGLSFSEFVRRELSDPSYNLSVRVNTVVGVGETIGIVVTSKQASILKEVFGQSVPGKDTKTLTYAQVNLTRISQEPGSEVDSEIVGKLSVRIIQLATLPFQDGTVGITEALQAKLGDNDLEIVGIVSSVGKMNFDELFAAQTSSTPEGEVDSEDDEE